jgi:hypothetical protein
MKPVRGIPKEARYIYIMADFDQLRDRHPKSDKTVQAPI